MQENPLQRRMGDARVARYVSLRKMMRRSHSGEACG